MGPHTVRTISMQLEDRATTCQSCPAITGGCQLHLSCHSVNIIGSHTHHTITHSTPGTAPSVMRDISHFPSRLRLIRCVHARYAQFARRVYSQCTRWVRTTALWTRQRRTVTPSVTSFHGPMNASVPSTLIGPPCVTSSIAPGSKQQ